MSTTKENIKRATPDSLWMAGRNSWSALQNAALWPSAALHPWRRESIRRLSELKDIHKDQRCFIIGNGPSLKKTDLSLLKREFTFGMNRIYLGFEEMGFETSYFLTINSLVIEQCADDIRRLKMPRFVSWRSRSLIGQAPDLNFLHTTYTGVKFAQDVRGRVWEGGTVTNVALQLAFHMGFQQAILVGVDHSYSAQGKPNSTVVSQGDDKDHFHVNYFGKGFRWQLPDLETSEKGYQLVRGSYEAAGRQVLDATVDGKLSIFPKVVYESLFG